MAWIHPVMLIALFFFALYVLWTGALRAMFLHRAKSKGKFPWRRHVRFGSWTVLLWLAGMSLGFVMAVQVWGDTFVMEGHVWRALIMVPGILVAYVTGKALDAPAKNHPVWSKLAMSPFVAAHSLNDKLDLTKARRVYLPALHGLNNTALILLVGWQTWTGIELLQYI